MAEAKITIVKPKVYFRADANTKIGYGHITRCLALAYMLRDYFHCIFLVQAPSNDLKQLIESDFSVIALPASTDLLEEAQITVKEFLNEGDIIVIDHYGIKTDYQRILKQGKSTLVCIDDLHEFHFVADAVINHAGNTSPDDYSVEPYTQLLLGTHYALLRPPFIEAAQKTRSIQSIETVFVCFGGSDQFNLSKKVTEACLKLPNFKKIHVVLGTAYPFYEDFTNFVAQNDTISLHQNLNAEQMVRLMEQCDLAIVPSSNISYEICAVGLLLITGYYVGNQKNIYQYLTKNKLAFGADNFENIEEDISHYVTQEYRSQDYLKNQRRYFNGRIKKNFLNAFLSFIIKIRQATLEDMQLYFEWTNDEAVRANSFNSAPITWESHQQWFKKKCEDKNCYFFVFEYGQIPIGQVRIQINDQEKGLINYSIDKKFRGLGLGKILIRDATQKIQDLRGKIVLVAKVKPENISSNKIFSSLGFTQSSEEDTYVYTLALSQ